MKQVFLYSSALTAVMLALPVPSSHAAIVTTTTRTYTYEFPTSTPITSENVSTVTNCPVRTGGGGGGGSGGGSGFDVNNDGVGDYSSRSEAEAAGHTGGRQVGNHDNPHGQDPNSCGNCGTGSSGSGGSGSSRVICTYFYQKGELDAATYYADMEYTRRYLKGATVRGYHFWAVPYARALRQAPGGLLEKVIRPVTIHRARELAYQMGVADSRPDYLGKFFRWTIEPVCTLIGHFVSESRWEKLYSREEMQAYAMDYALYQFLRDYESQKAYHALIYAVRAVIYADKPVPSRYL